VLPGLLSNNIFNDVLTDSKVPGEFHGIAVMVTNPSVRLSNNNHIGLRELSAMVLFSNWPVSKMSSSFTPHVLEVFRRRTKKQMIWSRAFRVIALMADRKTFRDRSNVMFPAKTMCRNEFPWPQSETKTAVAAGHVASSPFPATICFNDIHPKPLFSGALVG